MAELTTLARPYAKAAFGFALASDTLTNWSSMLATLSAVTQNEKVQAVLTSPELTAEQLVSQVAQLCGDELSQQGHNFVALLAHNKRLPLIPMIAEQFEVLKAKQEKLSHVEITSAYDVDSASEDTLAKALSEKLNCSVDINTTVDTTLIGGAIVRAGDLVIDSSIRGRLAKLNESMSS
jgi:F-type H+-transporting ATPase subunit delta